MDYSHLSNDELLIRFNQNDRYAFNEIYNRHWQELYRSAYYLLKDNDTSKDLLQDVFIWLWEHRGSISTTSIKAYLFASVKHRVLNLIRNEKIRDSFFKEIEKLNVVYAASVDTDLELIELKKLISESSLQLPEKCREIYNLSRNEHLSNKAIAQKLSISEKTVENQITTALKRLRVVLSRMSLFFF